MRKKENKIQSVDILSKENGVITSLAIRYTNRKKTFIIKDDAELIESIMIMWVASIIKPKNKIELV